MKIQVTQEHINAGIVADCWCCPIALATGLAIGFNACYPSAVRIRVGQFGTPLPRVAIDFIDAFDVGQMVKPFEFHLSAEVFMGVER